MLMRIENNIQTLLKRIGLNQYESAVYGALLSEGVSTVGGVAENSKVPRSRVYDVLRSLEKKGFTISQLGRPIKYSAIKPEMIVDKLKKGAENEYQKQIGQIENLSDDLVKELGKLVEDRGEEKSHEGISIIKGKENIHTHIKSMIRDADHTILKITDENGIDRLHKHHRAHLAEAKKRGVSTRILTSHQNQSITSDFKKLASTRHTKKITGRFLVKDGNESLLLTAPDTGIWVKGEYLANSLGQLFDHAWKSGKIV